MATNMNGFKKVVVVGVIAANFGLPLVGRAQQKQFEFPAKQDTISIEYDISKQMKEREMAKERLRMEIEKVSKAQDTLQNRRESLVKLGEKAGYKKSEVEHATEKEARDTRIIFVLWVYALVNSCVLAVGSLVGWISGKKKKPDAGRSAASE